MGNGMTNEQFNSHLEILAKLIEKTAGSVEEAAQIVRDSKIKLEKQKNFSGYLTFDAENLALPEVRVKKNNAED